jgi:co-chaperonin GroES (HSP10)
MEEKTEISYPYLFNGKKYRCPGDVIIIKKLDFARKKLALPNSKSIETALEHPYRGEVIAVGDGFICGLQETQPPKVNIGDIVYCRESREKELLLETDEGMRKFYVITEADIYLVQEKNASLKK